MFYEQKVYARQLGWKELFLALRKHEIVMKDAPVFSPPYEDFLKEYVVLKIEAAPPMPEIDDVKT